MLDAAEAAFSPLDVDDWLAHSLALDRALTFEKLGEWQSMLDQLQKALDLSPRLRIEPAAGAFLHSLLAAALVRLNRAGEAIPHMQTAMDFMECSPGPETLQALTEWLAVGDSSVLEERGPLVAAALGARGLESPVDPLTNPIGALIWAKDHS